MDKMSFATLGIWIGSPAKLPSLRSEGIFRFLFNLVRHLSLRHPLSFEIWCQQINLANVRELFSPLLEQAGASERFIFCTELNACRRPGGDVGRPGRPLLMAAAKAGHYLRAAAFFLRDLPVPRKIALLSPLILLLALAAARLQRSGFFIRLPLWGLLALLLPLALLAVRRFRSCAEGCLVRGWDLFKGAANRLPQIANRFSRADIFLVQNIDMGNVLRLERLKVINLHDLFACEFSPLFMSSGRHRRQLFQGRQAARHAERLARQGGFFICNSEHIRRAHAMAMIPGLRSENTEVIFLPAIIPEGIRDKLRGREEILAAFAIPGEYLFYPSHVRPYKNFLTLLKAFRAVRAGGHPLSLVLTGDLADDAACSEFVRRNGLAEHVILTGEISERDMYSLYRHSSMAVIPTLGESSFPFQALEAMAMEVPVVVSRIPVVEERLRHHGLEVEASGLRLFAPRDEADLARQVIHVLGHRSRVLAEQAGLRAILLACDWRQFSDLYFDLFKRLLAEASG